MQNDIPVPPVAPDMSQDYEGVTHDFPPRAKHRASGSHAFSLASKLATLDVGETIYLPDEEPAKGPTVMERNVGTAMVRAPKLEGRRFTTRRMVALTTGPLTTAIILAITREV